MHSLIGAQNREKNISIVTMPVIIEIISFFTAD